MKYIASCSFGKDSLATVILARQHEEPLDEVVYCEVMFDDAISGEIPEHRDFVYGTAIPRLESWGIRVTVIRSQQTYTRFFTTPISKGKRAGQLRSFPVCSMCSIQRDCKIRPIERWSRTLEQDTVQYIGYAKDEQERLMRLDGIRKISLLDKYSITESEAFEICKKCGLLSPIYEFAPRNGCFFCPNAKERELRHLYDHHRDLWEKMLELQGLPNKATEKFNREMTFAEIDNNFRFDDSQLKFW